MTEPSNCQSREGVWQKQCTKDDKNHIFGETAEERLHVHNIGPGDTLYWGTRADIREFYEVDARPVPGSGR